MQAKFPIPVTMPFARLGLPNQAARMFGVQPSGEANSLAAFRVAKSMRFGAACRSDIWKKTWHATERHFFPGVAFHRRDGELLPVEILLQEKGFADGDTCRVKSFWGGEHWVSYRTGVNVRMDGIDTPESNPSGKLNRMVDLVWRYLARQFDLPAADEGAAKKLIEARIVYLGKIADTAAAGFGDWARLPHVDIGMSIAPAYARATTVPELCDTFDMADKYRRLIGRIMAGRPHEGEELLAGFMEAALPAYMKQKDTVHRQAYGQKLLPHAALLAEWKAARPDLYRILCLESAPYPIEVYSRDECARLAALWRQFCTDKPGALNDLQTMLAFIGVAPPYQKYRGHKTSLDLSAELYALGGVPGISRGHGLTSDYLFMLMRPSADESDPYRSPLFITYEDELSGGKPLNPPDCCDVFGCGNQNP